MSRVRSTEYRIAGSLALSPARDLTVLASLSGAYEQDGRLAEDTLCFWGSGQLRQIRGKSPPPEQPNEGRVDQICDEPVVWAGIAFTLRPFRHRVRGASLVGFTGREAGGAFHRDPGASVGERV